MPITEAIGIVASLLAAYFIILIGFAVCAGVIGGVGATVGWLWGKILNP